MNKHFDKNYSDKNFEIELTEKKQQITILNNNNYMHVQCNLKHMYTVHVVNPKEHNREITSL